MTQSYDYDEGSETWPFFMLAVLCVILVPLTIMQLWEALAGGEKDRSSQHQQHVLGDLSERYTGNDVRTFRAKYAAKKSKWLAKRNLVIIAGWTIVAYLVQHIGSNDAIKDAATLLFDPYALLDISASSTDREIRSAYRKLSIKFHPDKLAKDLKPEERSVLEEQYVMITKAYKALTDEITRENYLKYGHPDGPQATSHGIALPKFLVDSSASLVMIVGYIALLGFILPFFVSRWWSKTQSMTKKGIHVKSASYFSDRLFNFKPSQVVTTQLMIRWISHSEEFKLMFPALAPNIFETLLHDHINRKHSGNLQTTKFRIVAKSHILLFGLLDIATTFRNLEISNAAIDTLKALVQAIPLSPYSQILQLPNVDAKRFVEGSVDDIRTLGKLFTYDDAKIGKILGIEDATQLQETLTVASNIPYLKLIRAEFKVPGESVITPLSTPHISLKVLVRSAKHKFFSPNMIPDEMCQDEQDFDSLRDPFASVSEQPKLPQSFAPYFPAKRSGCWCALVVLQKDGKVIQTPMLIDRLSFANLSQDFDKRTVKDLDKDFNPENWAVGTIKIPFSQPAPEEKGDYFFRVIIKSTEYFGPDLDFTVSMAVREPSQVEEMEKEAVHEASESEDDDSDLEEDEESNDELEEDENEYTDIDTDTDDEREADDTVKSISEE
ncbi:LANO_0H16314g1_1 [Lachancea nothofagi CBS 11611]|uniref:LANO_0H16314g1_1 n=1 Tax=Lachancea nothofagi CBS 11611 TaxID=1266666 RepID=A0A1G4KMW2_9SACH|nr:LANO_0H16314g1_1 [Lachancea nothofagi CBS 11611]